MKKREWSDGVMESWSAVIRIHYFNIPSLQYFTV